MKSSETADALRKLSKGGFIHGLTNEDKEALRLAVDEIARLRRMVRQIRGMADMGTNAPSSAYRWCERIEEVTALGPQDEYEKWAFAEPEQVARD